MTEVVRGFYDENIEREWSRLDEPLCRLEFASTLRLIERYFPSEGLVCDIGGGPGRYTLELLRRGYRVTLLDLSPGLLKRAERALVDAGVTADALLHCDACNLTNLPSAYFDAALLLGPLYHLVDRSQRLNALRELSRVLKPGGRAVVAYLNSWGILRCGVADFPERYADLNFLLSLLGEKAFRGSLKGFTESYWTTPDVALREVASVGFEVVSYAGAEGFAGGMRPIIERIVAERPSVLSNLERMAAETCELLQYRDATEHLHIVVRNQSPSDAQPGAPADAPKAACR